MNLFKITIEQRSAFLTEPTSGVLMGHLAWAYRYLLGKDALVELLDAYRAADVAGNAPPLICSAALPEGMVPRPHLRYLPPAERARLAMINYGSDQMAGQLQLDRDLARAQGNRWIKIEALAAVLGGLTTRTLYERVLADLADQEKAREAANPTERAKQRFFSGVVNPKNRPGEGQKRERAKYESAKLASRPRTQPAMNRLTGSVQRGRLFDNMELVYQPNQRLTIWVRIAPAYCDEAWLQRWRSCFDLMAAQGIGRRKSAGMGEIELVENLVPCEEDVLSPVSAPNGFISLSSWVPRAGDPAAEAYELDTRHGRLGGQFGTSDNVWKYPVTELLPGAVGKLGPNEMLRPVYGQVVTDVHRTRPEIVNFGYAFPVGVTLL